MGRAMCAGAVGSVASWCVALALSGPAGPRASGGDGETPAGGPAVAARLVAQGPPPAPQKKIDTPEVEEPPTSPGVSPVQVSRADLLKMYARVDRTFADLTGGGPRQIDGTTIARFNREFDAARIFLRADPRTMAMLESLEGEMLTTGGGTAAPSIGTAISVNVDPPVWYESSPATPRVRVRSFWRAAVDGKVTLELRWDDGRASGEGHPRLTRELELKKDQALELDVPVWDFGHWPEQEEPKDGKAAPWPVKSYTVTVDVAGYRERGSARFCVVDHALDPARRKNEARLFDMKKTAAPELLEQIEICIGRNRLLEDFPGTSNPEQFSADFPRLAREVDEEVARLAEGHDPYSRRIGEVYRPLVGRSTPNKEPVPCLVYACSAAAGETARPLVIAFHDAGADETVFFRQHGAGRLARLAEDKGFIVASVQSYRLGGRSEALGALVDQLARDYAIDRSRVYVIGHGMGAGTAVYFASARTDLVAAAVCFGAYAKPGPRTAPTRVWAGELDDTTPLGQTRGFVAEARERKLPVELVEEKEYGHTLIVGARMKDAVEWLLTKSLAPAPAK